MNATLRERYTTLREASYVNANAYTLSESRLVYDYLTTLGVGEHFFNYRHTVRTHLLALAALKQAKLIQEKQEAVTLDCKAAMII